MEAAGESSDERALKAGWEELLQLHEDLTARSPPPLTARAAPDRMANFALKAQQYRATLTVLTDLDKASLKRSGGTRPLPLATTVGVTQYELRDVVSRSAQAIDQAKSELAQVKAATAREARLNEQHRQLLDSINQKTDEARGHIDHPSDTTTTHQKIAALARKNKALMSDLSKYADRVFPKLSAEDVEEGGGGLVPKGSVAKFADTKFIAFISLLEAMMNRSVTFTSDPYIRLDGDVHWPFYVEFLLRWGIALKHPTKGDLIKLTEFHI